MTETPAPMRGRFYSTHSFARCPEYKMCRRCHMCSNYNRHNALCTACEGAKSGRKHECTFVQLVALDEIERRLNRPLFEVNQAPSKVVSHNIAETDTDDAYAKMIRQLG